mgnify:CR=1 FL=1
MLEVRNISSGYGKKQVLFNVSLTVKQGEVILLTGGNGSGKSTLLKCIYNLLPLWEGSIWFENERIDNLNSYDLISKGIVYIPQKNFYFDSLNVEENLQVAGNIYNKKIMKLKIEKVFELTDLKKIKKRKPFDLSGGEKKILGFGMAMLHDPKLVFFDEPFSGIDQSTSLKQQSIFKDFFIKNNIAVVLVEHKNSKHQLFSKQIILEYGTIKTNEI